jgi:hypothetical protein
VLLCFATAAAAAQQANRTVAGTAEPQLDLKAYEAQLDSYAAQISKARHHPADLARIRKSLPSAWVVRAGQTSIAVPTDSLNGDLAELAVHPKQADTRTHDIEARLAAMREAAAQLAAAERPPKGARTRLDAILRRPEFGSLHGPTELQILEARAARWLVEQIVKLLKRLHLRTDIGNLVGWIVIGIAFAFLCWWLWDRLATLTPKPQSAAASGVAAHASSRAWLDEALAAADRGEYREAVHCAYWAAIARLEDSGRLSRDRARTPRESLRQLRAANSGERETLRELTRSFELVWYGYRPVSAADWIGAQAQLENMGCLKASIAATVNS